MATHLCLCGHPSVGAVHNEVSAEPLLLEGIVAFTYGEERTEEELSNGTPALFDAMPAVPPASERKARGMKVTLPSLRLAKVFVEGRQAYLPDARILHVQRDDVIVQSTSLKRRCTLKRGTDGRRTGHKNKTNAIGLYDFAEYVLESFQVQQLLRDLRASYNVLCLSYEDVILQGFLSTYAPVFKFVGAVPVVATWLRDEKLSSPSEEYVRNYEELISLH
jgi:hypothetical protein